MKKILIYLSLVAINFSSVASANVSNYLCQYNSNGSGFYLGAQLGAFDRDKFKNPLYTGKLLGGYNINNNLGVELGAFLYGSGKFKRNSNFYTENFDLVTKFSLPATARFNVYSKLGAGFIQNHVDKEGKMYKDHNINVRPKAGIGMSYSFTPQVSGTIDYSRTFTGNKLNDVNFVGVGVIVKLGN